MSGDLIDLPHDAGDELPPIISRDYTDLGGHACCAERLPSGEEWPVYCHHRNHVTYSHVPQHRGHRLGISMAYMRLETRQDQAS